MSPAPWTYDINPDRSRALIVDADGFTVAYVTRTGPADITIDLELMTAAPDLLALAERIARLPEHGHYLALIDEARAAIAKATGEKS